MTEAPLLDSQRVEQFGRLLQTNRRQRIHAAQVWRAFAVAFPHRPQGPAERRLLVAALGALQSRGLLRLPSENSRRWDRTTQPPVPASLELVRQPLARTPDEWRRFPWHQSLEWVSQLRRLSPEQALFLKRVQGGLVDGDFREPAPLKYRSLQLTGHEKRLAHLARTALFGPGRLTLDMLGCLPETLPLAWEEVGDGNVMLILENAGPFTVACRVLQTMSSPPYAMVAYGAGASIIAAIGHVQSLRRPITRIDYVGDLDSTGLEIARGTRARAIALGLPPVRPATGFHVAMLSSAAAFGATYGWPGQEAKLRGRRLDTLAQALDPSVATRVVEILRRGHRIPEEVLGPGEMRGALEGHVEQAR